MPPSLSPFNRRRATGLLLAFAVWAAIVTWRLAQVMIVERRQYLAEMAHESIFEATIPALRGRILDRSGRPLAWSTRHLALSWHVPQDEKSALAAWQVLTREFDLSQAWSRANPADLGGLDITLTADASPDETEAIYRLRDEVRGLHVRAYFVRHYREPAGHAMQLGHVQLIDGVEVGMSGAEKRHDALLRGRPGMYRVMRDRHGSWLPETWDKALELRPGYDVYLPIRIGPGSGETS